MCEFLQEVESETEVRRCSGVAHRAAMAPEMESLRSKTHFWRAGRACFEVGGA